MKIGGPKDANAKNKQSNSSPDTSPSSSPRIGDESATSDSPTRRQTSIKESCNFSLVEPQSFAPKTGKDLSSSEKKELYLGAGRPTKIPWSSRGTMDIQDKVQPRRHGSQV